MGHLVSNSSSQEAQFKFKQKVLDHRRCYEVDWWLLMSNVYITRLISKEDTHYALGECRHSVPTRSFG